MPAQSGRKSVGRSTPLATKVAHARAPTFKTVNTRRTFEEVTDQVRELLLGGSLQPGDRLPAERELSKILGVGRPALREALRALEAAGLIELRKGKLGGAFVCKGKSSVVSARMSDMLRLGNVSVEELFEVRLWIQTGMVRAACVRRTEEDLRALEENVRTAEALHLQGRYDERIAINIEFHNLLGRATHNPVAELVVQGLSNALKGLVTRVGSELPRGTFTYRHDLTKALQSRDQEAAVLAVSRIIKSAEQTYLRLAQQLTEANKRASLPAKVVGFGTRKRATSR